LRFSRRAKRGECKHPFPTTTKIDRGDFSYFLGQFQQGIYRSFLLFKPSKLLTDLRQRKH